MKHKSYIDARVANELGMHSDKKRRQVAEITAEFVNQILLLLAEQGTIGVDGLGRFTVARIGKARMKLMRKGTRTVDIDRATRVYFSKSAALKKLLKENDHVQEG